MTSKPIVVAMEDVEILGGPIKGDPLGRMCNRLGSYDCLYDLILPESGAMILRVLWRWKERSSSRHHFGVLDVPRLLPIHNSMTGQNEWALQWNGTWHSLGHNEITDPCEALAAIVGDEAALARGGK